MLLDLECSAHQQIRHVAHVVCVRVTLLGRTQFGPVDAPASLHCRANRTHDFQNGTPAYLMLELQMYGKV